jgi:hypothetical protein
MICKTIQQTFRIPVKKQKRQNICLGSIHLYPKKILSFDTKRNEIHGDLHEYRWRDAKKINKTQYLLRF